MDEIEGARLRMIGLLSKTVEDPQLGRVFCERVKRENEGLYFYFESIANIASFGDNRLKGYFLSELALAYHVIEETTSGKIPPIGFSDMVEVMGDFASGRESIKKCLEEIMGTHPTYYEYMNNVLMCWERNVDLSYEITIKNLGEHLITLYKGVQKQAQKKVVGGI